MSDLRCATFKFSPMTLTQLDRVCGAEASRLYTGWTYPPIMTRTAMLRRLIAMAFRELEEREAKAAANQPAAPINGVKTKKKLRTIKPKKAKVAHGVRS